MVTKLTRLTHKIAIQLYLMAESCTICSSRSLQAASPETFGYTLVRLVEEMELLTSKWSFTSGIICWIDHRRSTDCKLVNQLTCHNASHEANVSRKSLSEAEVNTNLRIV